MKVNKHGLKMTGLKKASSYTADCSFRRGLHLQISYDPSDGQILTDLHVGQSWTQYRDPQIITVCNTCSHMTMQEIADAIRDAMRDAAMWDAAMWDATAVLQSCFA